MFSSICRAKKQYDRDIIVHQKETNKGLEEEIERLNLEQQRLKEIGNSIRIETREITRTIVMIDETPHCKQQLETQIKEENETYETLSSQIVLSPRKLKVELTASNQMAARSGR